MANLDIAQSLWIATTPTTNYPSLTKNIAADVVVIGGGITGITTAYLLKQSGLRVTLLEQTRIVQGTSGYTTGKVTSQHTLIYDYLWQTFGQNGAKQYASGQEAAIQLIADLVSKYQIDCDFIRTSAFTYTTLKQNVDLVRKEAETAHKLGLPARFVDKSELAFQITGAVEFKNQAQFHPRKYLLDLAGKIIGKGSHIFENSPVVKIKEGEPNQITTAKATILAKYVVVATNFPIVQEKFFQERLLPHHSCAIALKLKNSPPKGMYIRTEEPMLSVRNQPYAEQRLLVLTGHEPKTGLNPTLACQAKLFKTAKEYFQVESTLYHWATMDQDTKDRIPLIGRLKKHSNVFVATGFNAWGMTGGTLAGMIINDIILEKSNPYAEIFDLNRTTKQTTAKTTASVKTASKPKFDTNNLKPGQGKVIEVNHQKIALYKDKQGEVTAMSAVCPHMGCIVNFNSKDQTWDCPCHGSRFTPDGKVINGPAVKNLPKI